MKVHAQEVPSQAQEVNSQGQELRLWTPNDGWGTGSDIWDPEAVWAEQPVTSSHESEQDVIRRQIETGSDVIPQARISTWEPCSAGGSGSLAQEAARLYPGSTVTVFDFPEVIAAAQAQAPPPGEGQEAGPHVSFIGGAKWHCGWSGRGRVTSSVVGWVGPF